MLAVKRWEQIWVAEGKGGPSYLFEFGLRLRHGESVRDAFVEKSSTLRNLRYEGSFLMPRRRAAATVRASSRARANSNAGFDQPCQRCKLVFEDSSTIRESYYYRCITYGY